MISQQMGVKYKDEEGTRGTSVAPSVNIGTADRESTVKGVCENVRGLQWRLCSGCHAIEFPSGIVIPYSGIAERFLARLYGDATGNHVSKSCYVRWATKNLEESRKAAEIRMGRPINDEERLIMEEQKRSFLEFAAKEYKVESCPRTFVDAMKMYWPKLKKSVRKIVDERADRQY